LVVAGFVVHNEVEARDEAAAKLEQHARVIANALWSMDRAGPKDYLQQAIENDGYETLTVIASDGEVFYAGSGLSSASAADRLLIQVGLIPGTPLTAEVTWQGRSIGTIQAFARIPTVYADFYALVVGALLLIAGRLYLRLAATNRDLDAKVRERTREARESEQRYRELLANIEDVVFSMDAVGRIEFMSPAVERIYGYKPEEMQGRLFSEFVLDEDLPGLQANFRHTLSGNVAPYEFRVFDKSGNVRRLRSMSRVRQEHGLPVGVDGVVVDITELDKYRTHLEDLVSQRTAELRAARDSADEASKAKSRFLANMSHEIRTPMNAVLGFAQLLLRDSELTRDQRKHLETISRAGDHLMALIDGILQLAKVEAGHETLHESAFDLRALLDDLRRLFEPRATQKGLTIAVQPSPDVPRFVRADEGKLRQVLWNLIGNAVKFTAKGGVVVRVGAQMVQSPRRLRVEVEDTGAGISQGEIGRLFQKFEQTEAGRGSRQGTGLGLALCREFVHLMGGEISVESQSGRGSLFRFEIPFVLVASGQLPQLGPVSRSTRLVKEHGGDYRVLVADDVDDNRTLVTRLLEQVGFEVKECADGMQAVTLFETWQPPLVLLDRHMPVMDGLEAIRRIRRASGGDRVKIVCVSASVYSDDLQAALAAGADAFLNKPIRDGLLLEQIGQLLGVRYRDVEANAGQSMTPTQVAALSAADLARLPGELREELRHGALKASLVNLRACIQKIAAQDQQVADALTALVDQFAYGRILGLLSGSPNS
jgi:PAS domain S-box-containing protein